MNSLKNMPVWARWALYAFIGVVVLNVVQGFDDTTLLTAEGTTRSMLRWGVPILLAGLGGLFAERAGVVNIGLEGMMVLGTWFGAWGALTYGAWWGLLIGALGGAMGGLLHAVATVQFGVDHVISGVAINILGPGITRFLSSEIFAVKYKDSGGSITQSPRVPTVGRMTFPFLAGGDLGGWKTPDILGWFSKKDWFVISDITAILRGLVSDMSWVTVIALALVPFSAWLLWRTRFGLRMRISGERPEAGEAQGINIYFYKYVGVIVSGALAGLGGAFIASQELSGVYKEGSTGGRGFIGLAALIFGNWRPMGIFGGAMLFGYPFALKLQDLNGKASHSLLLVTAIALFAVMLWALLRRNTNDTVLAAVFGGAALAWYLLVETPPTWWAAILPYVIVLIVLIFFTKRLRPPAADGQIYRKGEA
ncbi:MAG: ABC transporter permease [Ilumatobacteraceae bacterium]